MKARGPNLIRSGLYSSRYRRMSENENEPVYKLFIDDLRSFQSESDGWYFKLSEDSERIKIGLFQIQARICKVTGLDSEILIVSDSTAKAKATRSSKVPGDFSWVKPDAYCSIVGNLLSSGKLPHLNIVKMAKLNNDLLEQLWPLEVKELKDFLTNKIVPELPNRMEMT